MTHRNPNGVGNMTLFRYLQLHIQVLKCFHKQEALERRLSLRRQTTVISWPIREQQMSHSSSSRGCGHFTRARNCVKKREIHREITLDYIPKGDWRNNMHRFERMCQCSRDIQVIEGCLCQRKVSRIFNRQTLFTRLSAWLELDFLSQSVLAVSHGQVLVSTT